jgi:signal peptidase I
VHHPSIHEPRDRRRPEERDRPPLPELGHTLRLVFVEILFETLAPAFVVALLINLFVIQSTYVHGTSMEPNLHTDQRLIVEKVSYRLRPPHRGDIVVVAIDTSDVPLIKRVIGLPGETVQIRDNRVWVDGIVLEERYLADVAQRNYGPVEVPPGHVFVMGDNRSASNDSRVFGAVPMDQIVGRAWLSFWPPEDIQLYP